MEIKYFALGTEEKNKLVNVLRIVFGIFCISIAIFWISFNIKSLKADSTLWITIIFLTGFGLYQIWAGLGRATRFIETGPEFIRLKKNPIFPAIVLKKDDIEKIELFPLNLIFFMKRKKRILLRFSSTYYDTNEKVKDEILEFADLNKIQLEIIEEKI